MMGPAHESGDFSSRKGRACLIFTSNHIFAIILDFEEVRIRNMLRQVSGTTRPDFDLGFGPLRPGAIKLGVSARGP